MEICHHLVSVSGLAVLFVTSWPKRPKIDRIVCCRGRYLQDRQSCVEFNSEELSNGANDRFFQDRINIWRISLLRGVLSITFHSFVGFGRNPGCDLDRWGDRRLLCIQKATERRAAPR